MKRHIFLLFTLVFAICAMDLSHAQSNDWRTYLERLAEEEMNAEMIENLYEELLSIENNPMNLNTVTREQLEGFPLLNNEQVEGIIRFLQKYKPLATVYELRNIPQLDYETVERVLPFFCVESIDKKEQYPSIAEMLRHGKRDIQFRLDKTLTQRSGYRNYSDSILARYPNRKYLGEDFYSSLRYSFRFKDKLQFGFTAEKDAGEPFFIKKYPKGFDHYGFHFVADNIGKIKRVVVGDYRLSFGQGLVLNNDFVVNKAWAIDNIARRTMLPKRHFSTAESGFFRGASMVYQFNRVDVTAFYSYRKIDANLSKEDEITSFKTDGLHRTLSERLKKRNATEQVLGGNVNYRDSRFQLGVSSLYYFFDKPIYPAVRDYNIYHFRGSRNFNVGIDYYYRFTNLLFAGEMARAQNGSLATLHAVHFYPSSSLSVSALHRYLPVSYQALYARAFSESSGVRNEHGVFLGATYKPFYSLSLTAFIDYAYFPWLKYNVSLPSHSTDIYLLSSYAFSRFNSIEARIKYKQKMKNMRFETDRSFRVLPYDTYKFRLRYSHQLPTGWMFRSNADMVLYKEKWGDTQRGYMLSQNVGYRGQKPFSADFFISYFNADTNHTRLYSYERNLLNTFYMPSFYGKGCRLVLSAKYIVKTYLSFSVKIGHTRYFNRSVIGSGTERIDGKRRTDVFTYLRWQF